ncbi:SWPV2-ORF185 [Shearwaterpox virus]|uniref:Anaphase-promoting complex subunit 11 n=1 Tax=Shearwaterpox virus TaxID=1974596 RepID=A0A1V0QGE3_CNPV|nr:SWPV2-ORF185 [Shearwaterpox virus]QRI42916.1 N1R/p28-like protein [Cheloniid poxvirus 1]QRM15473.1 N1R/p28-like protein [Mudlarkpox virus]QRM15828.1 n1r/p28-like protein [Penguinpox virus 2]QRM16163.1 n1r/p28-like protein [Albatrosspox virus]
MSRIIPPHVDTKYKVLVDGNCYLMFMIRNGYINVTKMCKINHKEFYRWKRLVNSSKIINDIEKKYALPESSSLIYIERKNNKDVYGFYAHPELAIEIAKWLSQDVVNSVKKLVSIFNEGVNMNLVCVEEELCPYDVLGECEKGEYCEYVHGDICDICGMRALHPNDLEQRRNHERICIKFTLRTSGLFTRNNILDKKIDNDKRIHICSICLEDTRKKPINDRVYGILSKCNHIFCLKCINAWMKTSTARDRCPECRQVSKNIIPSYIRIDEKKDN